MTRHELASLITLSVVLVIAVLTLEASLIELGTDESLYAVGLLRLCEGLRMQSNGSSDAWPDEQRERVVAYLHKRSREWRPSSGSDYDYAVRGLVEAVLAEVKP